MILPSYFKFKIQYYPSPRILTREERYYLRYYFNIHNSLLLPFVSMYSYIHNAV